jgi:1-acyl-sn-glycerol-3-phosphate acyltransferase
METLKNGGGLIIFSQGTRMKDFENAKGGVAVFALKTGAPIIPAGIRGTYRPFSKIYVSYGKPIPMDEYKGKRVRTELVEKVMDKVTASVNELIKEA